MENTKYGKRREGRWTPIRAKAQDTRANPNSWKTHRVMKRWDIGLLRALSPRIMMMMVSLRNLVTFISSPSCILSTTFFFITTELFQTRVFGKPTSVFYRNLVNLQQYFEFCCILN